MPEPIRLRLVIDSSQIAAGTQQGMKQIAATVDAEAKQVAAVVDQLANRIVQSFNKVGGSGGGGAGGGGIGGIFASIQSGVTTLAASIYSIERVANVIDRALIQPFVQFNKLMLEADERSRKFEISILGVVGSMERARALNYSLVAGSGSSPLLVSELRGAGSLLAQTPALANQFGPQGIQQFAALATRLGLVGGEGTEQALIALRQLSEGGSGGVPLLRRRFGLSEDVLAGLVGRTTPELRGSAQLRFQAVQRFADLFLPEEALSQTGNLISRRLDKLREAFDFGLTKIADSHVFDSVSAKIGALTQNLFKFFGSDNFDKQANRIGADLDRIFAGLGGGLLKFATTLTGAKDQGDAAANATEAFALAAHKLADAASALPAAAATIGSAIHDIVADIDLVVWAIGRLRGINGGSATGAGPHLSHDDQHSLLDLAVEHALGLTGTRGPSGGTVFEGNGPMAWTTDRNGFVVSRNGQFTGTPGGIQGSGISDATKSFWGSFALWSQIDQQSFGSGNRYATRVQNLPGALQSLNEISVRQETPLDKLLQAASNANPDLFGTALGGLRSSLATDLKKLGLDRPSGGIGTAGFLGGYASTGVTAFNLIASAADTAKFIQLQASSAARNFGEALFKATKDLPPDAAAAMQQIILAGTTSYATAIARITGLGAQSLLTDKNIPLSTRVGFLQTQQTNAVQAALEGTKYGSLDLGSLIHSGSASQIIAAVNGATPVSDRTAAQNALAIYTNGGRQRLEGQITEAFGAYQSAKPGADKDAAAFALLQTIHNLETADAKVRELRRSVDYLTEGWLEFGVAARDAFQNSLGSALDDMIWRGGKLKDVLLGFAHDITRAFTQMASKDITQGLFGDAFTRNNAGNVTTQFGGIFASLFGGGGGSSAAASSAGAGVDAYAGVAAGAEFGGGGIVPGFIPFHSYADGGIAMSRTLGLIAETGNPEAFVPLRSGKIPVEMRGGGGGGTPVVHVTVVANHDELVRRGLHKNSDLIVDMATQAVIKNKKLGRAIRHQPG